MTDSIFASLSRLESICAKQEMTISKLIESNARLSKDIEKSTLVERVLHARIEELERLNLALLSSIDEMSKKLSEGGLVPHMNVYTYSSGCQGDQLKMWRQRFIKREGFSWVDKSNKSLSYSRCIAYAQTQCW